MGYAHTLPQVDGLRLIVAKCGLKWFTQLKELIVKKSVLCLALSLALVLAFAPVHAAENMSDLENSKGNPVDQFTGTVWQKTPEAEKLAFLFGLETAITVEFFVNGKVTEKATKEGKRPVYTL